jgi:hypothetical protein
MQSLITGIWYEAEIQAKPVTANVVLPRSYHRTNGKVGSINQAIQSNEVIRRQQIYLQTTRLFPSKKKAITGHTAMTGHVDQCS